MDQHGRECQRPDTSKSTKSSPAGRIGNGKRPRVREWSASLVVGISEPNTLLNIEAWLLFLARQDDSGSRATEGQYLATASGLLQVICPVLHHPRARPQIESMVIGCTHGITRRVGKLQFDVVMVVTLLMENRGGQ